MATGILDIVEGAYATDIDGQEWLARLTEGFASRFPNVVGWGGHVITRTQDGPPTFHNAILTEVEDAMTVFGPLHTNMDPALAAALFPTGTQCALFSEHWERVRDQRSWDAGAFQIVSDLQEYLRLRGGDDLLFCFSYDRNGTGVLLAGIVDGKPKLGHRVRHIHRRAAVHVAAGLRMRRALATAPLDDHSEAVFEADGRLAHAAGRATYGDVRDRLREAVRCVDRARTDAVRREEVEALELWQGLVEGRWSLIDRYDTDGRRYYVAMANPPDGVDARQLTGVEAQVTAQVVAGEPNGIIAYSLGVSESTVAGHLSNAMRKLGARSRIELIRVARALGA